MPRAHLPRPVWLLGWVSLATDAATEAVYPLLPFFLTQVLRTSAVSIGIVEGAAEAANSLLKILAGRLSDRVQRKRPIVVLGYSISSFVRPFIAVTTSWTQVFAVRVLDRVGKGVRGAPRDAMLAAWATPATRGRVYGFHRGMDHVGAVVGPAFASLFLWFSPEQYRLLFALTIVPGVLAVGLLFLVPEPEPERPTVSTPSHGEGGQPRWLDSVPAGESRGLPIHTAPHAPANALPPAFSRFMIVLALFTLGNSTDAFLLLKLTETAGSPRLVPLMWSALHVVKASVSMVGGSWSDRIGRRAVIGAGWVVYAAVYAGFAVSATVPVLFGWFVVYGVYFGLTEGTERALVADLAPAGRRGLAFGIYNAVTGLGAFAASLVFGLVWTAFGPEAAFGLGSALALAATALLFVIIDGPDATHSRHQRRRLWL